MRFLLRTLSLSYVTQHFGKTFLTLVGVAAGVATFAAIRGAERSLLAGFQATVDRVAGKAHLQIAGVGGVPENLQEALRGVAGVAAVAPVIEQVVQADSEIAGSILILGVDLVGDRQMREYAFAGEDADEDDPLLFLAQPDSIALSRDLADRARITKGDSFVIRVGNEPRRLVVRAVIQGGGLAEAFGGSVAVTDVYAAQEIFGRGRRFDHIDVRLQDGTTVEEAGPRIQQVVGAGFVVESPDRRGVEMERLISNFTAGLGLSSTIAVGIGGFLVFNVFAVAVTRRRRDIGILRAIGATPRQVQTLFLVEAAVLGLLGGLLGVVLGSALVDRALIGVGDAVEQMWGLSGGSSAAMNASLAGECLGLGIVASVIGAWIPSARAARVAPVDALAPGPFLARVPPASWRRGVASAALLIAAIALGTWLPRIGSTYMVVAVLVAGSLGTALAAGPAARGLIVRAAPMLSRLSPVCGRLAADSLIGHLRRTSGMLTAIALSLTFVIGSAAYFQSTRAALLEWADAAMTSDLFVRTSVSLAPSTVRFPSRVKEDLLEIAGIRSIDGFRQDRIVFRGDPVKLVAIEGETIRSRPRQVFQAGDAAALAQIQDGKCAVSTNFSRRFGLGIGDVVELDAPAGTLRLPIVAVLNTFLSDRGAIVVHRAVFSSHWNDDRLDILQVNLVAGADPLRVRERLRSRLAGVTPAVISTRQELSEEVERAVAAFHALSWAAVMISLAVAFIGIVSSLLISVEERMGELGILKALGAVGYQIRMSVIYEALGLALSGLIIGLPLGLLLARFLSTTVSETYAGFRLPSQYPFDLLIRLLLALPIVSIAAAWVPARRAARTNVADALSYE